MIRKYKDNPYGQVDYYCIAKDVPNLPKASDNRLTTGSSAYCIDTKEVYLYDEENDKWWVQ
jgi:hypothetical protein